jgi:phospholipid/cholesterol/gamma-HCH transport system ATP-binding protein
MSASTPSFAEQRPPVVLVDELAIAAESGALVEGISFTVAPGEIFGIVGRSGAGKSALLRALVGLETPRRGHISIADLGPPTLGRGLPPFGVMFQGGALFASMTLLENVELPLQEWTSLTAGAIRAIAAAKLHVMGLDDAAHRLPPGLPGDVLKRAALARAIALDPPLAFLDEPTAGLDPSSAVDLNDLVAALVRSTDLTVVMVTHDLPGIFRIVDQCILLDRDCQRVVATGDPRMLRDSPDPRTHAFFNPDIKGRKHSWRIAPTT